MGVTIKTKRNRFPQLVAAMQGLDGRKVRVGARGEMAWLAGIHEYGCSIPVTDKMRAYLHSQGLHLKTTTQEIVIPERSFLRTGFDTGKGAALDAIDETIGLVLGGELEAAAFFDMVGLLLESAIRDSARNLSAPPLHPFTVARRKEGSDNPLNDTGNLIESICYEVT